MPHSTINLIPPRIKRELQLKQILNIILVALLAFLVMTIISYGAFFATNYYLFDELSSTETALAEQEVKIKKLEPLEKKVILINSKLEQITSLKSSSMIWSEFLEAFESSVPENVQIDNLQIDNKAKTVTLSGKAESRRDIVKLETKLNTMDLLAEMAFTSSTRNEEDNVYTFSMSGIMAEDSKKEQK